MSRHRTPSSRLSLLFLLTALLALPLGLEAQKRTAAPRVQSGGSSGGARAQAPSRVDRAPSRQSAAPRTAAPRGNDSGRTPQRHSPRRGGDHRGGHGHVGHHHGRGHHGSFFFGYYGYPYYRYHYYPYGYYHPYYYPVRWYRYRYAEDMGALDLNVRPKNAEVYVNGQHIGRARAFDGFPTGHLWLDEGTYDLVFYHEGHETLHRRVKVFPGITIDVSEELVPGQATAPDEVIAAVLEEHGEPQPRARRASQERSYRRPPGYGDEGYDRPRPRRRIEPRSDSGSIDARGEPARLFLAVEPPDASVYLDGRFLGTGEELSRLHDGLIIDPGEHLLSVVRPGHAAEEVEFSADAGEDLELDVALDPASDA